MKSLSVSVALLAMVALLSCSREPEQRTTGRAKPPAAPATASAKGEAATAPAERLERCEAALLRGAQWLLKQQQDDGTFGGPAEVGKTGLVLTALLSSPDADKLRETPAVRKAAAFLIASQQPDGSINTPGDQGLANYQTSAALTALCLYDHPAHEEARRKARDFLVGIQNTDGTNLGSWGYNRDKRGDLSNTQFTLEALKAAGLDENSEAFQNCRTFLQRCHNLSESNDQEWATNDGGAIYYPGRSNAGIITLPNGKVIYKSYGSMTYALLRGYVLVGLQLRDPRVQAALKWLTDHYTLEENPGMPDDQKLQGLYYYYLSMAKALALLKSPTLRAPDGTELHWAADLGDRLAKLQGQDGSWKNDADRWMESDKVLATAYAMQALAECTRALATTR